MENYFRVQNYAEKTKEQYIPAIRKLMEFFGELRDFEEDVRNFTGKVFTSFKQSLSIVGSH